MNDVVVSCDEAKPKGGSRKAKVLELRTFGLKPNVRTEVDVFRLAFLTDQSDRLDDAIRIAALVYAADTRVSRGSEYDVFADRWRSSFRFAVPVWDLDFWSDSEIKGLLSETLGFLSDHEYGFEFRKRVKRDPTQEIFNFKESITPLATADCVVLFSGGSDSLAATLEAISEGKHPVLVSHRAAPVIDSRQKHLVEALRERFPNWVFPHVSMWVNRANEKERAAENTQRARSFLFTTLGAVTASMLSVDDVRLCDNGVMSINLPQSGQNVGAMSSRSTHPRYLRVVEKLMRHVTGHDTLTIRNTLLFKTRKEVLQIVASSGHPELLQETVSCAHVEGKTKMQPHCGVCSQCIDRRFASIAAGLDEHDMAARYEKDIFTDALEEGEERTHAENYVRFALKLESIGTPDVFFKQYPEIYDCLPETGDAEVFARNLWNLFSRHQEAVNGVLERKLREHAREIRRASLPSTCLLAIVGERHHVDDSHERYARRLQEMICRNLAPAFQTVPAKNEKHVQDVGQTVFQAAGEQLAREAPQLPFGAIATKPDFAKMKSVSHPLFVEFKYPKTRSRLNAVVTEMTSRVQIYRQQGAGVLFIVYDPSRTIGCDQDFIQDFEKTLDVWVGVTR